MSKPKKTNNLLYIMLGLTVVVAAAMNMAGDPPKASKVPSRLPQKNAATGPKSEVAIQDEDLKKTFPVYKEPLKDAYKQIVMRTASLSLTNGSSNQIPASFAGGESNWIYTGSATMDGRTQGLVENTTTGEGAFLSPGQRWKTLVCTAIRDDGIVVTGPDGDVKTVALLTEPKAEATPSVAPLNPAGLTGQIDVLPDPTATQGGGTGRRGRRNRGGNGGGMATDPTTGDGSGG